MKNTAIRTNQPETNLPHIKTRIKSSHCHRNRPRKDLRVQFGNLMVQIKDAMIKTKLIH
ncbi:hypothetical protein HanPSC8_Chr10g0423161 [Helianthus annuus]|nr:hypothetical protein HanPSC8_Chr10g0423161 [Helianthus annuus]